MAGPLRRICIPVSFGVVLPVLILLSCPPSAIASATVRTEHLSARLVAPTDVAQTSSDLLVGIQEIPAAGWHTYWINPGETGLAASVTWTLPAGVTAGALHWPAPVKMDYAGVTTYGYTQATTLLVHLHIGAGRKSGENLPVKAHIDVLVCEKICVPESFDLNRDLKISAGPAAPLDEALKAALANLPPPLTTAATIRRKNGFIEMGFVNPAGNAAALQNFQNPQGVYAFLETEGIAAPSAAQRLDQGGNGFSLRVKALGGRLPRDISAVLKFADGRAWTVNLTPGPLPEGTFSLNRAKEVRPATSLSGLGLAVALAFAGGLILNLMPCVFPILSIKILALTRAGHDTKLARTEALLYGAGAVTSFLALAGALDLARDLGASLGWGFQLQSPFVTGFLSLLLLLVALNMSGLFGVGSSLQSLGGDQLARAQGKPRLSAFLTGVLAVVIAAPCSAPFMATAIGVAMAQGGLASFVIFLALGIGFAAVFVVLTFAITVMPSLARLMPRPGIWMDRLRAGLAVPIYGAALWMIWVFAQQVTRLGLIFLFFALCLISLCAVASRLTIGVKRILLGLGLISGLAGAWQQQSPLNLAQNSVLAGHEAFSTREIAVLRAKGKPILVDLTAAWCLTCKVNEAMVLSDPAVQRALHDTGTTFMVGDWTRQDKAISNYLHQFGRSGVPLYVFYGAHNANPIILPQTLNKEDLINLLKKIPV